MFHYITEPSSGKTRFDLWVSLNSSKPFEVFVKSVSDANLLVLKMQDGYIYSNGTSTGGTYDTSYVHIIADVDTLSGACDIWTYGTNSVRVTSNVLNTGSVGKIVIRAVGSAGSSAGYVLIDDLEFGAAPNPSPIYSTGFEPGESYWQDVNTTSGMSCGLIRGSTVGPWTVTRWGGSAETIDWRVHSGSQALKLNMGQYAGAELTYDFKEPADRITHLDFWATTVDYGPLQIRLRDRNGTAIASIQLKRDGASGKIYHRDGSVETGDTYTLGNYVHVIMDVNSLTGKYELWTYGNNPQHLTEQPVSNSGAVERITLTGNWTNVAGQTGYGCVDDLQFGPRPSVSYSSGFEPSQGWLNTNLFSDDFESGNFTAGGWTTQDADATVATAAKYTGTYGAKLAQTTWIQKMQSTANYNTIHIKYDRRTYGLDAGEYLYVEWSTNGTTWNNLETTQATTWASRDFVCSTGANNNANFRIRFRTNASSASEYAYIDNVVISGEEGVITGNTINGWVITRWGGSLYTTGMKKHAASQSIKMNMASNQGSELSRVIAESQDRVTYLDLWATTENNGPLQIRVKNASNATIASIELENNRIYHGDGSIDTNDTYTAGNFVHLLMEVDTFRGRYTLRTFGNSPKTLIDQPVVNTGSARIVSLTANWTATGTGAAYVDDFVVNPKLSPIYATGVEVAQGWPSNSTITENWIDGWDINRYSNSVETTTSYAHSGSQAVKLNMASASGSEISRTLIEPNDKITHLELWATTVGSGPLQIKVLNSSDQVIATATLWGGTVYKDSAGQNSNGDSYTSGNFVHIIMDVDTPNGIYDLWTVGNSPKDCKSLPLAYSGSVGKIVITANYTGASSGSGIIDDIIVSKPDYNVVRDR